MKFFGQPKAAPYMKCPRGTLMNAKVSWKFILNKLSSCGLWYLRKVEVDTQGKNNR